MEDILVSRQDGIVHVTLNRPERLNAITRPMWQQLTAVLDAVARSPEDRVLVLTGAEPAFCSGADLEVPAGARRHPIDVMRDAAATTLALHRLAKPTIARVDGAAVGAGLGLALACDLVVASDRSRFCAIFSRRAMSPDAGSSWVLPRLVGMQKAKELVLLAEMLDSRSALHLGLVNRVVPAAELDGAVAAWAERLVAGPHLALAFSKQLLNRSFDSSLEQALEAEASAQSVNMAGPDIREARKAFEEKRQPRFGLAGEDG